MFPWAPWADWHFFQFRDRFLPDLLSIHTPDSRAVVSLRGLSSYRTVDIFLPILDEVL